MNFSPSQLLPIESTSASIGVIAGAGSGKTAVLVERAKRMLDNCSTPTIFSLTNSSVNQIVAKLEESSEYIDVTTVHGFCYKIVCENAEFLGYSGPPTVIDDDEKMQLIKVCRAELGGDNYAALKYIEYACDGKLTYLAEYPTRENALQVSQEFRNRLKANNQTTYERLVLDALYALKQNADKYHSLHANIMIDEAQDIDKTLWKIIEVLNPETIFAVGDPRQAIFGFRGGDAAAFERLCNLDGSNASNTTQVYYLTENYRSRSEICSYSNALFPSLPPMRSTGDESVNVPVELTTDRIVNAFHRNHYNPSDTTHAILCPTNHELDMLETELTTRGIAFRRLRGQPKVTDGARFVRAFVRIACNPWDEMTTRLCFKYLGKDANQPINQARMDYLPVGCSLEHHLPTGWKSLTFDEDGTAELARIQSHLDNGNTVESYLLESSRGLIDGAERQEIDPSKVTLATIHLAKGREFDHVYISTDGIRDTIEGRRAFYVAVTRAKYSVTICTNGKPCPEFIK